MGFSKCWTWLLFTQWHQRLGALYDTPHGNCKCNYSAYYVMEYNAKATGEKYRDIAKAMGVEGTENVTGRISQSSC